MVKREGGFINIGFILDSYNLLTDNNYQRWGGGGGYVGGGVCWMLDTLRGYVGGREYVGGGGGGKLGRGGGGLGLLA